MTSAGLVFTWTANPWVLLLAATIGVISPSGNEVGPFLPIEQAALSHVVDDRSRTDVFAWYTLAGSLATALGALAGGMVTHALQQSGVAPVGSYRAIVIMYSALGVVLAALFTRVSRAAEVTKSATERDGFPPPLANGTRELRRTRRSACGAKAGSRPNAGTTARLRGSRSGRNRQDGRRR